MAIFYRGAGIGSHWHANNARLIGFVPWNPAGSPPSADRLMQHIGNGITESPYISLTRSFGVAHGYAVAGKGGIATPSNPGQVYELEIANADVGPGKGFELIDPVKELSTALNDPLVTPSYQHDGDQNLLLGVVRPGRFKRYLTRPPLLPNGPASSPPNVSTQLKTLVQALRDAEILAVGTIPSSCIRKVHPVW
jgi:hypothetical protein